MFPKDQEKGTDGRLAVKICNLFANALIGLSICVAQTLIYLARSLLKQDLEILSVGL